MDRSEINRALAKVIAYKACGKDEKAKMWAVELIRQLECMEVLDAAKALYLQRELING